MSVSSFSEYESDDEFIVIPKDKDEELPCLLNGTKRRKPTLESYVAPANMRDTVYRCREFPKGIYIDRFGKAQPNDKRTGIFVENEHDDDEDDEEDDEDEDEDEEDAQRFITTSPTEENEDDEKELNNVWLSKFDEDYEEKPIKRRKVYEDYEEETQPKDDDDNWIQHMTDEQRQEYEETIRAVEKGHVRQKRLLQLTRALAQVQTFEEVMEPLVKLSPKYEVILKYKMDQNLFGSCQPYSNVKFKYELLSDAYIDVDNATMMWNEKAYKNMNDFVNDLKYAADHLDIHVAQEHLKKILPSDISDIICSKLIM